MTALQPAHNLASHTDEEMPMKRTLMGHAAASLLLSAPLIAVAEDDHRRRQGRGDHARRHDGDHRHLGGYRAGHGRDHRWHGHYGWRLHGGWHAPWHFDYRHHWHQGHLQRWH